MAGASWSGCVRLPQGWLHRVRSAAVHAISLADLAFTKTLSWAADCLNPRLRRSGERGPSGWPVPLQGPAGSLGAAHPAAARAVAAPSRRSPVPLHMSLPVADTPPPSRSPAHPASP
jgi:hypothetical protein